MSFQPVGHPRVTVGLARCAVGIPQPAEDLALADRALLDPVAVWLAASSEPILQIATVLPEEAQWAVACHIIDFDDLTCHPRRADCHRHTADPLPAGGQVQLGVRRPGPA